MIVAEIVRNLEFVTLANYAPFVYVGTVSYYTMRDAWGDDVNDIFDTGQKIKVKQVTRDYLNKYIEQNTLAECEAQEASFYFDRDTQQVYVHVEHEWSPQTAPIDYGYALGVCSQRMGLTYIDDYLYEGVITDGTSISHDADVMGTSQPKGSTSSMEMINSARYNELTKKREGILDFLFTENIYNNDVFVYNYKSGTLTPKAVYYVEDYSVNQQKATLNLQDERFNR